MSTGSAVAATPKRTLNKKPTTKLPGQAKPKSAVWVEEKVVDVAISPTIQPMPSPQIRMVEEEFSDPNESNQNLEPPPSPSLPLNHRLASTKLLHIPASTVFTPGRYYCPTLAPLCAVEHQYHGSTASLHVLHYKQCSTLYYCLHSHHCSTPITVFYTFTIVLHSHHCSTPHTIIVFYIK